MPSIHEIVETPSDWLQVIEPSRRQRLERLRASDLDLQQMVASALAAWGADPLSGAAPDTDDDPPLLPHMPISKRFLNELHDLLCSKERYQEEQKSLLKEYNAGRSAFVAMASSVIGAQLGVAPGMLSGAIALALSVAGPIGLNVWCGSQAERRHNDAIALERFHAQYERELKAWNARQKLNESEGLPAPDPITANETL